MAVLNVIDFFCGAGGASAGLLHSDHATVVAAVNHDAKAIACHGLNHPEAVHYNADIKVLNPEVLKRNHPEADAFWWSSECTHLSVAKGGLPRDADSRMLNFELPRYARVLRPKYIFIENVSEIVTWGPLKNGRVDPARKGELYRLWVKSMERLGYRYDYRILNSADFGALTSRPRYFGIFALGDLPIQWPAPTHADPAKPVGLLAANPLPWRQAREVLDLDDHGRSIFGRKRPLAAATIRRIAHGLERFAPKEELERLQFLIKYYGQGTAKSLVEPLDTITTKDRFALVTAQFLKKYYGGPGHCRPLTEPLPTITTVPHEALITTGVLPNGMRDIKLRMLSVEELRRAQGFPEGYLLPESQTLAKKFIGNSVVPLMAEALVRAQVAQPVAGHWLVPVRARLAAQAA